MSGLKYTHRSGYSQYGTGALLSTGVHINILNLWTTGDFFNVEYLGFFYTQDYGGTWTFTTTSDDESFLFITNNGTETMVVNNGGLHGAITISGTISLLAYTYYPIKIRFSENDGASVLSVHFSHASVPQRSDGSGYYFQEIPQSSSTPVSGAISLLDLQNVFGGTNPIGFDEYYQNASPALTNGVSGIPNIGASISLDQFYNKTKSTVTAPPPSSTVPAPVATTNFGTLLGSGSTGLEWLTGVSGANLTRTEVSTFDNRGLLGQNRTGQVTYANLILQARAGDSLRFIARIGKSNASDPEATRLWINLGSGTYTEINIINDSTTTERTHNYTVPTGTPAGNYAIAVTNDYSTTIVSYRSANYYSLHVF